MAAIVAAARRRAAAESFLARPMDDGPGDDWADIKADLERAMDRRVP